jgi:hypothetical protein
VRLREAAAAEEKFPQVVNYNNLHTPLCCCAGGGGDAKLLLLLLLLLL